QELISQNDQEAFYQLLAGAGGPSAGEIDRAAEQALLQLSQSPGKPAAAAEFSIPQIFEHAKQVETLRRERRDLEQLGELAGRVGELTRQKAGARSDSERAAVAGDLKEALAEFQAKA